MVSHRTKNIFANVVDDDEVDGETRPTTAEVEAETEEDSVVFGPLAQQVVDELTKLGVWPVVIKNTDDIEAEEHLPGKHDQKSHGKKGAGGGSSSAAIYEKLKNGEIKNARTLGGGISETWQGEIEGVGKVVIRPSYGDGSGNRMEDLKVEMASHAIDRALGQAVGKDTHLGTPEIVLRDGPFNGKQGVLTVQRMLPGKTPYAMERDSEIDYKEYERIYDDAVNKFRAYDHVIENGDRHQGNMIYHEGEMRPIDQSLAFRGYGYPSLPSTITRADRDAFTALTTSPARMTSLRDELSSWIPDDTMVDDTMQRITDVAGVTAA